MLASHFFLPAPVVRLTVEHVRHFEQVLEAARQAEGRVSYAGPYPKFEFLFYLAQRKRYLLHGSPQANIAHFKPKRQTAALDPAVAVYATDHETSALFAAVRPNARLTLSGYFWARDDHGALTCFYDFAYQTGSSPATDWLEGTVYVLPREAFDPWGSEWASRGAVRPLFQLPVTPADFPLRADLLQYEGQLSGPTSTASGFVAAFAAGRPDSAVSAQS